jgi:hypothetical protein
MERLPYHMEKRASSKMRQASGESKLLRAKAKGRSELLKLTCRQGSKVNDLVNHPIEEATLPGQEERQLNPEPRLALAEARIISRLVSLRWPDSYLRTVRLAGTTTGREPLFDTRRHFR